MSFTSSLWNLNMLTKSVSLTIYGCGLRTWTLFRGQIETSLNNNVVVVVCQLLYLLVYISLI